MKQKIKATTSRLHRQGNPFLYFFQFFFLKPLPLSQKTFRLLLFIPFSLSLSLSSTGCFKMKSSKETQTKKTSVNAVLINGAGASFPYPLYSKWIKEYHRMNPSVKINYQSIGSGGGIRQLLNKTVFFGASDAPMKDSELKRSQIKIIHIPTVLGAVVITYNLPLNKPLKLTPSIISNIFLGKIKQWNHPELTQINPELKTIQKDIIVVHRSDGSGTTAVFTDYISKVSSEWNKNVGKGKSIKWPIGIGAKGNEGVAGTLKQVKYSIGYLELIYAKTIQLPFAQLKNKNGNFVYPSLETVKEASKKSLKTMPDDFRISITNPEGKNAYPIASYTYLLLYNEMEKEKGEKLKAFILWALSEGQEEAKNLSYAPLPPQLAEKVKLKLNKMNLI